MIGDLWFQEVVMGKVINYLAWESTTLNGMGNPCDINKGKHARVSNIIQDT